MDPFKCCTTLQYFVMVCLTINIVHANSSEEYTECIRQINAAFGNNDTSTGCFRHAVKYYKREEKIPIPPKVITFPSDQKDFGTPTVVTNFEDLISSTQSDLQQFVSNMQQNTSNMQQNTSNEHKHFPNYASLYHKELGKMIQAGHVIKMTQFCEKHFIKDIEACFVALKPFGNTSKDAVEAAFNLYRLADCNDYFIHKYMEYIIETVEITRPSTRPQKFCNKVHRYEAYMRYSQRHTN